VHAAATKRHLYVYCQYYGINLLLVRIGADRASCSCGTTDSSTAEHAAAVVDAPLQLGMAQSIALFTEMMGGTHAQLVPVV
jgi:hypothetical protein